MRTSDDFNYGTLISFANSEYDNAFTLTDYSRYFWQLQFRTFIICNLLFCSLVLYVNNQHVITDVYLNDGFWHYVCASWTSVEGSYTIFIDGSVVQNNKGLATGNIINGKTLFVVQYNNSTYWEFLETTNRLPKPHMLVNLLKIHQSHMTFN